MARQLTASASCRVAVPVWPCSRAVLASASARIAASQASSGTTADLAELVPDPRRRPGGLGRVGVAHVQQHAVGQAAHIRVADRAEGGEGGVPGGALVRGIAHGFGTDRLGGVGPSGTVPACADRAGTPLPVEPVERTAGHRAESVHRPRQGISPIRSVKASIIAASSPARRGRSGSARTGTCADHGPGGNGTSAPRCWRIRASMTAATPRRGVPGTRAPVRADRRRCSGGATSQGVASRRLRPEPPRCAARAGSGAGCGLCPGHAVHISEFCAGWSRLSRALGQVLRCEGEIGNDWAGIWSSRLPAAPETGASYSPRRCNT